MKQKWYLTPGWKLRLPLMLGLLVGAAFVEGLASTLMIVGGLLLLVHGWISTFKNVRRVNKEVEGAEGKRLEELDRETEEYFRRTRHA